MDLPTAVLLPFAVLPFPELDLLLYESPFRVATAVLLWALIVWPMLLRLLLVFRADLPVADVDLAAVMLPLLRVPTLRPLLLLWPRALTDVLLVLPIELPMRELFCELTRVVELEADRPAVLVERTSTVRCTFEDLPEGLLERAALDRLLLELLPLETDELRPPVRDEDALEELEGRLQELLELLLRELLLLELLLREPLLRELLLRELLLREPLLRELLLRELLLREPLLLELLLREPPLLELFAGTGSATRIRVRIAATTAVRTCFLHFSVNMICL
ncbi:MAG: hypothetical protein ACYST6_15385, partial [Planctomycetota bacterium]